jgi:thiol-disulfide isomerase/thioredoxin
MKLNIYMIVFGVIAAIIVIAALSTIFFNQNLASASVSLANLTNYGPAPNFQGISAWINSQPLNISQLKGKIVLVDFWTYSCINCIRTIPFLEALQSEYGNNGLVIVGVHTPEFQFEHNLTNVENAVKRFNITYPVALDNNYSTWDAYGNEYWPADYLIDQNGDIRYKSFGESPTSFNQTQKIIQELLESANYTLPSNVVNVRDVLNFTQEISPEMYFGWEELASGRTNYFGNLAGFEPDNITDYVITNTSQADTIYMGGKWYNDPYSMIAESNRSKIILIYRAKSVNVVASGNGKNTSISVTLDGQNLSHDDLGSDDHLVNGTAIVNISAPRLYNIVNASSYGWHTLEINANPNFKIYTFTFG